VTLENSRPFIVGIPVYDGVDLLDVSAPCEIFGWMAESWTARIMKIYVVAENNGSVMTRCGLPIVPHKTFDQVPYTDLLWVPGGDPSALTRQMKDFTFIQQLRGWAQHATYVTSVCEGALLLAAAHLLDGFHATTHWAFLPCLREFKHVIVEGAEQGSPRFVIDPPNPTPSARGIRVTGAGVSAGMDEALQLVKMIGGQALAEQVQLNIQYFPKPPVSATPQVAKTCFMDPLPLP
jgi:transcriptional regulator GlxA family with amidase domain